MHRVACLLLVLTVAGCSQPTGPANGGLDESSSAPDEPLRVGGANETATAAAQTLRHFRQTFDLLVNPDTEVIGVGGTTENAVLFWDTTGTDLRILNGTARLNWSPGPNTPSFRIEAVTTQEDSASPYGGSPVEWSFAELTPAGSPGWGVGFCAAYTVMDGTIPVALPMKLKLEFTYLGTAPEPRIGGCGGGGV